MPVQFLGLNYLRILEKDHCDDSHSSRGEPRATEDSWHEKTIRENKGTKISLSSIAMNTNNSIIEEENLKEYLSFGRSLFKNKDRVIKQIESFDETGFNNFIQNDDHEQSFREQTASPSYSPIEIKSSQSETHTENDSDMDLALSYLEQIEQEYYTKKKPVISNSDDCIEMDIQKENINSLSCHIPNKVEVEKNNQSDFEFFDQPMQIYEEESSQEEEKVIELVDLMAGQVTNEYRKKNIDSKENMTVAIRELKSDSDKFVINSRNKQSKISTEELKLLLNKEKTNQNSHSSSTLKISYLNNGPETELFRKLESVLLEASKKSYENLNDSLKNSYKFERLTTDICQFMLNQQVKHIENEKLREIKIFKLRWHLLLFTCVESIHLLWNCGWETMIVWLMGSKNVFNECIKSDLNDLLSLLNQHVCHPKLSLETPKFNNLCEYIRKCEKKSTNNKYLIVLETKNMKIPESLCKHIQYRTELVAKFSQVNFIPKDLNFFEKSFCLVLYNKISLLDHVCKFTHVILFEPFKPTDSIELNRHNENIKRKCEQNNIQFCEFELYCLDLSKSQLVIEKELEIKAKVLDPRQIIVSKKFLKNSDLIEWFESKLNFELIERDVDYIANKFEINKELLCNVDMLLDEFTGVSIFDLDRFIFCDIEEAYLQIRNFKFTIDRFFMIFVPFEKNDKNGLEKLLNIKSHSKYSAFVAMCDNLSEKSEDFRIKTIFLYKNSQLVETLNQICLNIIDKTKNAAKLKQTILLEVNLISHSFLSVLNWDEHLLLEAFLLSLGCFNSFAAQRLLSVFKITEIISMEDYSLIKDLNILTENRFELMLKILKYK